MRISISALKLFKACRQAYRFKYIEGLEPVQKPDAMQSGLTYHSKIEDIYTNGYCSTEDNSKESAMALAYEKYIYPHFHVKAVEDWVEYDLGQGDTLIGRVDGRADDGYLVEHKTTSMNITDEYEYELQWDEQILAYMLATGDRKMWYTVIRRPTIRQKKNESDEDFFTRMCQWYDEDTDSKIRLIEITRTDEEVQEFLTSLLNALGEIKIAIDFPQVKCYRNCLHCNHWGRRCEYSSICLNYDPDKEYIEFQRRERS